MSRILPQLIYKLPRREELMATLVDHAGSHAVFIPGPCDIAPGSHVELSVVFQDEPRTFRMRGIVRWKRESIGHTLPPGIAVELLEDESPTRDLMIAYASGYELEWTARSERRLPVAHPISIASGNYLGNEVTADLSKGGAFITVGHMLPVGSDIDIKLKPEGELFVLRFSGTVMWQSTERNGIGVKFQFPNSHVRQRFEAFVDRLSEQADDMREEHGPQGRL